MRQTGLLGILAVVWLLTITTTASAQLWPGGHRGRYGGYGGYDGYGAYGAWGAYTSALNTSTSRYVAQSDRLMGEKAAMQQSAMMQQGMRNTLTTQAEARTQNILSQQQSNRDWWFQVQQQQLAQRRAMPSGSMAAAAPATTFESEAPASTAPKADTDIIRWLPLLCEPQFAQQRARVEAPYRRSAKGEANPTPADYQDMIDAAEKMKSILQQMTTHISAQEYLNAAAFLDQLAAEARGRIQKDAGTLGQQGK